MPKQNRPLVRDGRLQVKKKRTDRSYLRPDSSPVADESILDADVTGSTADEPEIDAQALREALSPDVARFDPHRAFAPPQPTPPLAPAPTAAAGASTSRLPTAVRAIQQQGVRRRREFDVHALAVRDTQYAFHELRRIAVLASMVIVTLVLLWVFLR